MRIKKKKIDGRKKRWAVTSPETNIIARQKKIKKKNDLTKKLNFNRIDYSNI